MFSKGIKGAIIMDEAMIEKVALDTIKEVDYIDNGDSIDIIQIAKRLGFVVGNAFLNDDDDDGFIVVDEGKEEIFGIKTDKLIGVNSSKSLEWKRFIIAHEIGHYKLHYSMERDGGIYAHRDHKKGKNIIENEADFFAANILMPREKFSRMYSELKEKKLTEEDIAMILAKRFVVTQMMASRRIGELRLSEG